MIKHDEENHYFLLQLKFHMYTEMESVLVIPSQDK